jgi:hypothetical protein
MRLATVIRLLTDLERYFLKAKRWLTDLMMATNSHSPMGLKTDSKIHSPMVRDLEKPMALRLEKDFRLMMAKVKR